MSSRAGNQGASQSRTRFQDLYAAWLRHHRLSAADSLQRVLDHPVSSVLTWLVIGIAMALPSGLHLMVDNVRELVAPRFQVVFDARGTALLDGLDLETLIAVLEETGRSLFPSPLVSTVLAAKAIERFGNADQQARWIPGLADGTKIGTFAFLRMLGFSINSLTLFGLVLAIGLVVDDARDLARADGRLAAPGAAHHRDGLGPGRQERDRPGGAHHAFARCGCRLRRDHGSGFRCDTARRA